MNWKLISVSLLFIWIVFLPKCTLTTTILQCLALLRSLKERRVQMDSRGFLDLSRFLVRESFREKKRLYSKKFCIFALTYLLQPHLINLNRRFCWIAWRDVPHSILGLSFSRKFHSFLWQPIRGRSLLRECSRSLFYSSPLYCREIDGRDRGKEGESAVHWTTSANRKSRRAEWSEKGSYGLRSTLEEFSEYSRYSQASLYPFAPLRELRRISSIR